MPRKRNQRGGTYPPLKLLLVAISSKRYVYLSMVSNAMSLSNQQQHSHPGAPTNIEKIIELPHVGYVSNESKTAEFFVIGTSHFQCNSANEVRSLIDSVKPDGVVIELDPERVLRLTKQHPSTSFSDPTKNDKLSDDILYGADFVSAIDACQRLDIPLFLGDEYVQETKQRVTQQFLNLNAYSPAPLLRSLLFRQSWNRTSRINVLQTFTNDPKKLTPLVVTSSPPFVLASALAFFDNGASAYDGSIGGIVQEISLSSSLETALSLIVSFFVSCLLFNTVIAERDEILAGSTMQASKIVRSLKENKSIRRRWSFTVNVSEEEEQIYQPHLSHESETKRSTESSQGALRDIPLFTLKNPLEKGKIRSLNLFEPRWLKMIDRIISKAASVEGKSLQWDTAKPPQFGCVRCTNKFYSAISIDGSEGRYADVIFEKAGALANIVELEEGKRPVSGDRKINVSIQGGESFIVDDSNLSVSDDGYMVASSVLPVSVGDAIRILSTDEGATEKNVRMVVVVGLLHGNGVVDLLSKAT